MLGWNMSISASQALKDYNVDLLKNLPLENAVFLAMVDRAGLLPLDGVDSVKAKSTRAEKVSHLLDVIKAGADTYLPKLLKVMKDSGVDNVVQLANKIAAATGIGKPIIALTVSFKVTFSWVANPCISSWFACLQ